MGRGEDCERTGTEVATGSLMLKEKERMKVQSDYKGL